MGPQKVCTAHKHFSAYKCTSESQKDDGTTVLLRLLTLIGTRDLSSLPVRRQFRPDGGLKRSNFWWRDILDEVLMASRVVSPPRILVTIILLLVATPLVSARSLKSLPSDSVKPLKAPIQIQRPYNIAHRGSNGELPEETEAAYKRAIVEGADFIETDILASKDGVLFSFHDVTLDAMTDVANYSKFTNRKTTYEVQGVNVTGFFVVDFTWAELQTLRQYQRWSFRDHSFDGKYPIISFEQYIQIALEADRIVGIYPECKNPVFINEHVKWPGGQTVEDKFAETLLKYGYKGKYLSSDWMKQPLFIQSFAPTALLKISKHTDSPLIFLIDDVTIPTQDTNQSFYEITTDDYFKYLKTFGVVGIGPWKDTIAVPNAQNYIGVPTNLVEKAHRHGIQVHPYTFRNENQFLHFDFHQDPYQEYAYWTHVVGVDGFFTDFTGSLKLYQDWTSPLNVTVTKSATELLSQIEGLVDSFMSKTNDP